MHVNDIFWARVAIKDLVEQESEDERKRIYNRIKYTDKCMNNIIYHRYIRGLDPVLDGVLNDIVHDLTS